MSHVAAHMSLSHYQYLPLKVMYTSTLNTVYRMRHEVYPPLVAAQDGLTIHALLHVCESSFEQSSCMFTTSGQAPLRVRQLWMIEWYQ